MVMTGISKGRTDKSSISRMPSSDHPHHVNRPPIELEDPRSTPNLKRYSEPPAFRHGCALVAGQTILSRMLSSNQPRHMNRQPVELEDPRSIPDLKRYSKLPTFRHRCALCGKLRSSAYQRDHPIAPGEAPILGVCSRPGCSTQKRAWSLSKKPPPVMVLELHCYIYENHLPDQSTEPPLTVQLPGAEPGRPKELVHGDYGLSTWTPTCPNTFEEQQQAPWVNRMTKPTFIPR